MRGKKGRRKTEIERGMARWCSEEGEGGRERREKKEREERKEKVRWWKCAGKEEENEKKEKEKRKEGRRSAGGYC